MKEIIVNNFMKKNVPGLKNVSDRNELEK